MRGIVAAAALALVSCQAPQPAGPASLQIVPPSYYSGRPAPRAAPRSAAPEPVLRRDDRGVDRRPAEAIAPPNPADETLDEVSRQIDGLNQKLQRLRRSITRPANRRAAPEHGLEAIE